MACRKKTTALALSETTVNDSKINQVSTELNKVHKLAIGLDTGCPDLDALAARVDQNEADITDLKEDLNPIKNTYFDVSPNLFNQDFDGTSIGIAFTGGIAKDYILRGDGTVEANTGTNVSYPIEVEGGKTVYFYRVKPPQEFTVTNLARLAFYDADYNYIAGSYNGVGVTSATAPANAKYMIGCAQLPSYQIFGNNILSVVSYDDTLTEYVEYYAPTPKIDKIAQLESRVDTVEESIPTVNAFNSANYPEGYDWQTKLAEYSALLNDTDKIESFCFFTDQHLFKLDGGFQMDTFEPYISELQKIYNSSPCSFIVSGGDWLNNGDTKAQACFNLGYVDGVMRSMFDRHYMMVGNHDTNYQGYEYKQNPDNYRDCMLSDDTIKNLWFKEQGKTYYSFDGNNAKYYVLDTGIDWWNWITADRKTQMDWLAGKLISDNPAHATILMHIAMQSNDVLSVFADGIGKMITGFNNHTVTESINGTTYDFTNTTGHIDYVLSGHRHADMISTIGNVPLIVTTNFTDGNKATFDLVLVDYDNSVVKMVRIGTGTDRTVQL